MTGNQVKKIRERASLTQKQFAAKLGVSRWTIVAWELGRRPIVLRNEKLLRLFEREQFKVSGISFD